MMKTFFVQTLGCRVNHYESEQIAELLRSRGLTPAGAETADLRIINTCSVTTQAASQSRQGVRRLHRLPILVQSNTSSPACALLDSPDPAFATTRSTGSQPRILVMGCWATSNPAEAAAMPGVDAVLGHHHDLTWELDHLLTLWQSEKPSAPAASDARRGHDPETPQVSLGIDDNFQTDAGTRVGQITKDIEPKSIGAVNRKLLDETRESTQSPSDLSFPLPVRRAEARVRALNVRDGEEPSPQPSPGVRGEGARNPNVHAPAQERAPGYPAHPTPGAGTVSLPLLGRRQPGRQRAYLKIQDGCDAHCTYCIIPTLRPSLWSKPIDDAVSEARALVEAGHVEIVLTGIFLGAYGQPTALRRRQPRPTAEPLGELIDALCNNVPGLRRLRLSSLEPGDLTPGLIEILRSHSQVMPHFHLPLQSGSDLLLRKMNRQYTRDDFLRMVENVNGAFDRPALTTDIVVGFPGEDDAEFEETADLVKAAGFIHVHAFPYSPRPGTAAARWTEQFVRGPVVNERIEVLREIADERSVAFRQSFVGQTVEVIAERESETSVPIVELSTHHGRCERYFPVHFSATDVRPGDAVRVRIEEVNGERTMGRLLQSRTRDQTADKRG